MGPCPSQSLLFLSLITLLSLLRSSSSADDISALVFKGCADQSFQNFNAVYKQTLDTLLASLISQSSAAKFHKSTAGDGSPSALNGLFQCRGDLSQGSCRGCVERARGLARRLCGDAMAARVQLNGCYLRYEISGFRQVSGTELLYKVCGSSKPSGSGFETLLDSALGEVVKGVANGGYYAGAYQSVYVLGQCEGDLSGGDCADCVKSAIDRSNSVCGGSVSAQIYLQACYISYTYYPSGVPNRQQPYSPSGGGEGSAGRNTQKTVALVLGGLVGVGLVMACLLFTRSAFKKKPYAGKYGG
ncbi:cysteine-rich repeat secretory protein 3 [Striga asiatica]|uniref:Cysteine-rich repeat secretory protein 3 n=1 Tax=Striga asiatica TaxID=4170 RepID=A0A5A7NXC9_STRAF|nr:cysteine-rich repeat secretory protein 3 [Striga asiatica]